MTASYNIEPAFDVLTALSEKFQEIDVTNSQWMKGEQMSRHIYLIERYHGILKGYIMMRQSPRTFAGFQ